MYTNVLRSIHNIEIWPVISFVIFFLFFLILIAWVFTVDKKFINTMKNLPINDSKSETTSLSKADRL